MWTSIIGILNGLFSVLDRLFSVWQSERERQAGRNEERLQNAREAINARRKADEIDAMPSIADRVELLKRLRATPRGYYMGQAHKP